MKLSKDNITSEVDCGLINYIENTKGVSIFCDIGENIPLGENTILLKELKPFICGNYNITLKNEEGKDNPKFTKANKDICDLYSFEQAITIGNTKNDYELRFKIISYNKEILIFDSIIILDK